MENQEQSSQKTSSIIPEPNNPKSKKPVVLSLAILLVVILVVLGYLFIGEKGKVDDLNNQLNSLNSSEETTPTKNDTQKTEQTSQTKTTYTAEVGKFTLTLDPTYTIIKNLDGGFEGGPATRLQIGTPVNTGTNVVGAPLLLTVSIEAVPQGNNPNFNTYVSNSLSDREATKQTNTTVASKTAQVYKISGFGESKEIYFQNNNIYYKIAVEEITEATQKVIDDVIAGFTLN
jgi:uncharacterized protein YxeA